MKKILIVILLFAALGFAQEVLQDTVVIKAKIAELQVVINNIAEDANKRIANVRYAIIVLEDMIKPPKEEVKAEESKKKKKK